MTRTITFYWLTLLSIVGSAQSQTVLWSRVVGDRIIVHGRNLSCRDVNVAECYATLDGKVLEWVKDNSSDGPMSYGEVQFFRDPGSGSKLVLTREDGKNAESKVERVVYEKSRWSTGRIVVNEPIIVSSGCLADCEIIAATGYNGPCVIVDAVKPVRVSRVSIKSAGRGIEIRNASSSVFEFLRIQALESVYAPPQHTAKRNNWLDCQFAGTHPQRGYGSNRGILGEECFVSGCQWGDADRGVVAQQSGPPMYGNLLYRCVQRNTGTTIGGSEGILFESYNGLPYVGSMNQRTLNVPTTDVLDARPGLFVFDLDKKRWARIVSSFRWGGGGGWSMNLDRDMPDAGKNWFIGNAAVDNTIVHLTATSGKNAAYFFGRSSGNVCRYWDCRDVHDPVIEEIREPARNPDVFGFAWGNTYDRLRVSGCSRGVVRTSMYYEGSLPESQLPWYEWAK